MWSLAEKCEVIPSPPNGELARLLNDWWTMPCHFGCLAARTSPTWLVVAPDPSIWCDSCALERFDAERRCCYCHQPIRRINRSDVLVYELRGQVRLMGRAHASCSERACRG